MVGLPILLNQNAEEVLRTQGVKAVEENIYNYFDGESYSPVMVVGSQYDHAFLLSLKSVRFLKRKGVRAKLEVKCKKLTEVEKKFWFEWAKDEIIIQFKSGDTIKKLTIFKSKSKAKQLC